jgi:hypothetical protein
VIHWKHLAGLGVIAVLLALGPTPAAAATKLPRLSLHPVQVMGYVGESLHLRVEVGCGAELYGVIASEAPGGRLQLAAALDQGSIVCTSVPTPRDFMIDFLATRGFKTIEPMPVAEVPARLMVAPISRLKQLKTLNKRARLDALYQPRCGHVVGTLLRPSPTKSSPRELQLAVVERQAQGTVASGRCKTAQRTLRVSVLEPTARYRVVGLRVPAKTDLKRAYELRLARTHDGSLRVGEHGGIQIRFDHACNEAPIGVVLGNDRGPGAPLGIGIVVARHLNVKCGGKVSTKTWREPDLSLPAGRIVTQLERTHDDGNLIIMTPSEIGTKRQAGKRAVSLSYAPRCGTTLGAIYARDQLGKLSAGALVSGGAYECKKPNAEVSLTQAYVARRVRLADLNPLRLRGQPAH